MASRGDGPKGRTAGTFASEAAVTVDQEAEEQIEVLRPEPILANDSQRLGTSGTSRRRPAFTLARRPE